MNENNGTEQLLAQILEVQRTHLEEYKRVTSQSLDLQRQGVETQTVTFDSTGVCCLLERSSS